jgi:hypothetical protein
VHAAYVPTKEAKMDFEFDRIAMTSLANSNAQLTTHVAARPPSVDMHFICSENSFIKRTDSA